MDRLLKLRLAVTSQEKLSELVGGLDDKGIELVREECLRLIGAGKKVVLS